MSLGAYSTVSFNERGERSNEDGLYSNDRVREDSDQCREGEFALDICKPIIRFYDHHDYCGEVVLGLMWWQCFTCYVEREGDNGMFVAILRVARGTPRQILLACTVAGDVSDDAVRRLRGAFLDRAKKAFSWTENQFTDAEVETLRGDAQGSRRTAGSA